jgi:hypothetical protein
MRKSLICGCILLAASGVAAADEPQEKPAPAAAEEAATPTPAPAVGIQVAVAEEKAKEPVKLPPGFREKKRGKYTVYCRKDVAMGSRFASEKCYDERGLRDYIADQRENQKQVDQMRRICGSMDACGGGG